MLEGDCVPTSIFTGMASPAATNFASQHNSQCHYDDPIASRSTSQDKSVGAKFDSTWYTVTSIYKTGSVTALNKADHASEPSLNKMLIEC
ncbi:MAG: hypothetical protein HKN87_23315 [Saprospiraceae bacterium]|nr:hypothetical protein [Saprospiraceae bacterium]